jgi:hypothetical protein
MSIRDLLRPNHVTRNPEAMLPIGWHRYGSPPEAWRSQCCDIVLLLYEGHCTAVPSRLSNLYMLPDQFYNLTLRPGTQRQREDGRVWQRMMVCYTVYSILLFPNRL